MTDRIRVARNGAIIGHVWLWGVDYVGTEDAPISRGEVWRAERIEGERRDFDSQATAEGWLVRGE